MRQLTETLLFLAVVTLIGKASHEIYCSLVELQRNLLFRRCSESYRYSGSIDFPIHPSGNCQNQHEGRSHNQPPGCLLGTATLVVQALRQ